MRFLLIILSFCYYLQANASQLKYDDIIINADEILFEKQSSNIKFNGNISAKSDIYQLFSDHLTYNNQKQFYKASGNVEIISNDNNRILADKIKANTDYSFAELEKIRARIDSYFITAKKLTKNKENYHANSSNITTCEFCKNGKKKILPWQIYAKKVNIDNQNQNIYYNHAILKLYHIPVFYTPYLTHPTIDAKKRSGLLTISYERDSLLGNKISTPLFINLAPNYDLTYTPSFFRKDNIHHNAKYRHLFNNAKLDTEISYVKENKELRNYFQANDINLTKEKSSKWAINTNYNQTLPNDWNLALNSKKTSDHSYLRRYREDFNFYQTSQLNLNKKTSSNFTSVNMSHYDDFRWRDQNKENNNFYKLPNVKFYDVRKLNYLKLNNEFDLDLIHLKRNSQTNLSRISATDTISKDFIFSSGLKLDNSAIIRSDFYQNKNSATKTQNILKIRPQIISDLTYPMLANYGKANYYLEPRVQFIANDNGGNDNNIENNDSEMPVISNANIFDSNKYAGFDRVENGAIINYGFLQKLNIGENNLYLFAGQNYRFKKDSFYNEESGMQNNHSDYVGSMKYIFSDHFNLTYNFNLLEKNLHSYRNEIATSINYDQNNYITANYVDNDKSIINPTLTNKTKSLSFAVNIKPFEKISFNSGAYINMLSKEDDPNSGILHSQYNITYHGQCIDYKINLNKSHIKNISTGERETKILFSIGLKGLSQITN
jgi:LPS-assembly protein